MGHVAGLKPMFERQRRSFCALLDGIGCPLFKALKMIVTHFYLSVLLNSFVRKARSTNWDWMNRVRNALRVVSFCKITAVQSL